MVRKDFRLRILTKVALYSYLRKQYVARKRWFYAGQALMTAVVIALSVVLQTYLQVKPPTYKLDSATYNLIGDSRDDTAQYLTKDEKESTFNFVVPEDKDKSAKEHVGRVADIFEATFATDAKKGITYTDTATKIGITVTPKFRTYEGKKVDGDHIVYPANGSSLIYTLKYNGLKEDIIIPKFSGNNLDYEFDLNLPSGVEARLDAQGNIGIYSSDPTLFGEMSYGSDADRAKLDKARENSAKTNLVVTIPSPIVKDANGKEYNDKASFSLGDKQVKTLKDNSANKNLPAEVQKQLSAKSAHNVYSLKLSANNLKDLSYPISLDPTIRTTENTDFKAGNFEGNIEEVTADKLIKRGSSTGGTINSWQSSTVLPASSDQHAVAVYNGYIYLLGGVRVTTRVSEVWYAPLSSTGSIGTWTQTTSFTNPVNGLGAMAYNGYIYINGGHNGSVGVGTTQFAPIKANGSVGTWVTTSTSAGRYYNQMLGYNGYAYTLSGFEYSNIQSAPINADGSLGSWVDTSTYTTARGHYGATIYNGYMYVTGGCNVFSCATSFLNDVQFAKINTNGTLNTWQSTTNLSGGRMSLNSYTYNGYLYIAGGCNSSSAGICNGYLNTTEYAQINSDGSVGSWRASNIFTSGRTTFGAAQYKGYLYVMGGCTSFNISVGTCATQIDTEYYAKIDPAGEADKINTSTTFTTARWRHASVTYNSKIYVVGGCSTSACANADILNDVQSATINDDGSLGTWSTINSALPGSATCGGRYGHTAVIYQSHLIVMGGVSQGGVLCNTTPAVIGTTASLGLNYLDGSVQGSWTTGTALTTARKFHTSVMNNGFVYAIGGIDESSTYIATIEYAEITRNTSTGAFVFGSWTSTTPSSPYEKRQGSVAVANANMLYIVGGIDDGSSYNNNVLKATLNSNGSLGTFSAESNTFTTARSFLGATVVSGYLYIIGGYDGTNVKTDIQYSKIDTSNSGTLGAWQTNTDILTNARHSYGVVVDKGYLLVTGGCNSGSCSSFTNGNTTEYIKLNNGGAGVGVTWTADDAFTTARFGTPTVALNGYLYLAGGCTAVSGATCTTYTDNVQKATIGTDGDLGTWSNTTGTLPAQRMGGKLLQYNGYLYHVSGLDNTGAGVTTIYKAKPNTSTGDIPASGADAWASITPVLPITNGDVLIYKGFMYVTNASFSNINYNQLNASDGTLSASWTADTDKPTGGNDGAFEAYNGNLYYIGGTDTGGNAIQTSIAQYAPINSDGSIGTWKQTSYLPRPTQGGKAVAYNGMMYLMGGWTGGISSVTSTCQRRLIVAPILSDGTLGEWTSNLDLDNIARAGVGATIVNGVMYRLGGNCGNPAVFDNTVKRLTLSTIPRVGSYSKLIDFDTGVKPTKLITRGNKPNGTNVRVDYKTVTNSTGTTFTNSQTISDTGYYGSNAQSLNLGTNITLSRYLWIRYTLDDSLSAVFPDSGNESTITDFDVYFTANPGKRLKNGRTFTNGTDRGLDAAPQ